MPAGDPMGYAQEEMPLAYRLLEDMPGIAATMGFSTMRGSNTMMYGGFMDKDPTTALGKRIQARRAKRYSIIQNGSLSTPGAGGFYGGIRGGGMLGARAQRAGAASKTPFLRSARLNNLTMRPRSLTRYHSASILAGADGAYSPFGASAFLNNTKMGQRLAKNAGIQLDEGEKAFAPGLLSGIAAGVKTDRLERKALQGSSRAAAKLEKIDQNLARMYSVSKPSMMSTTSSLQQARTLSTTGSTRVGMSGMTAQQRLAAARAQGFGPIGKGFATAFDSSMAGRVVGPGIGTVGVRGNMMASMMPGMTGYYFGYVRGALGGLDAGRLSGRALEGAQSAQKAFLSAFQAAGLGDEALARTAMQSGNLMSTLKATDGGVLKGLTAIAGEKGGAKFLAARGAALAIPGLNVLATASLVYDLGKMGGELIKSGINLARDANRSLQGSIAKPAFGMGYKDTEAAATSRARGVMAIQNSRLNARSMLGTEAAMMAAHYG